MTVPPFCSVAWFEFGTDQPEEAVMTPEAPQPTGGVWESLGTSPNYAAFYVHVQDVAETVERGQGLGTKVLMEPVSDSAGFTFARLRDTTGDHFGVLSAPAA
ncbi:VOC family protein [Streptomyces sp. NPDC058642]|uniref:VOC family protein n=1 Tax=Streptomyces sp. NPDC058642 TaxID=3346572 RepID=UPI003655BAE9